MAIAPGKNGRFSTKKEEEMKKINSFWLLGSLILLLLAFGGCSSDSPTGTDSASDKLANNTQDETPGSLEVCPEGQFQFAAKVQTADQNSRMLTFYGHPETVVALQNCEIVRFNNDNDSPIPFEDINAGDSVGVYGEANQYGYIYAQRLRQYKNGSDCIPYDLSFRDVITEIDYENNTFVVSGRSETIMVDENTIIWANATNFYGGGSNINKVTGRNDSLLTFTDLVVGDEVEVKANVVNEETLLAVKIKLPTVNFNTCNSFQDQISSIDYDTRIILFEQQAWIGKVCPKAKLYDATGEPLTLEDFSAGDAVEVKGRAIGDTLKICEMELLEN